MVSLAIWIVSAVVVIWAAIILIPIIFAVLIGIVAVICSMFGQK